MLLFGVDAVCCMMLSLCVADNGYRCCLSLFGFACLLLLVLVFVDCCLVVVDCLLFVVCCVLFVDCCC